jgi:hypothetical protein
MREGRAPDTGAGRRCDREEGPIVPQRAWFRARPVLTALTALCAGVALASGAFAQAAKPAPKAGPDAASVKASFDAFASEWMDRMQRVEDDNRRSPKVDAGSTSYRGYGNDFRVEIKPTGYAPAPYVGVLRYEEQMYGCSDPDATQCRMVSRMPVTELFRYQDGRWVY